MCGIKVESEKIIINNEDYEIEVECIGQNLVLANINDYRLVKNKEGELDLINDKYKRRKRSICRCLICKKYFLRNYTEKSHLIQCVSQRDNLEQEFYNSEFGELDISYEIVDECSVDDMIKKIEGGQYRTSGVWALWSEEKCIQVAKSQDIGKEIYGDFENGEGSIDYLKYKKSGKIVIITITESSFDVEAKYAFDHKALHWKIYRRNDRSGRFNEWCRIKELLNVKYYDKE